ncbi:MCE family protein [Nocardioides sp. GY 10127]|uniref:MCE family protein n=1 Tax=Nocardioides sp. GY 10127 TaxID=2569762 RepID=UPI0010A8B0CD|nr:MCE family protein [Nocardioides sp. GY 10127]TIC79949.1 MCE family protein [Nocardioides sp. GY 10127]
MLLSRARVLGLVFLALLLVAVWLTYAQFTGKFRDYTTVTLRTTHAGLQLPRRGDVKIRGVIVGEVMSFDVTSEGVDVELGLFPDATSEIPANVSAYIVPKTLFGEKYVSLQSPDDPAGPIQAGDVITQTRLSTEVEEVLDDLYPLLRTVRPADLNATLNALATALEGRGEALGQNIVTLDRYLRRLNPQLPKLIEDLRLTAKVSDLYADVLPAVGQILDDTVTTTTTLRDREDTLNALFTDVTAFSGTARTFLRDNEDNLISLGQVSEPQVRLLAKYAPEFSCLAKGLVNAGKIQSQAWRNHTLHIVLETLPNQPRAYTAADVPRYGETRGPSCLHLPNPPFSQENPLRAQPNMDDGVDEPTGKGTSRVTPSYFFRTSGGRAGSIAETDLLKSLLAPGMGTTTEDVPDLGALLVGPMARGAEVSLG